MSIWGAIAGAGLGLIEGRRQHKWDEEAAAWNYNWQEHMANTAYQRAMADMRKAGLNPILAYKQGPAATPSTSALQTTKAGVAVQGAAVGAGVQRQKADIENIRATTAKTIEETRLAKKEADLQELAGSQKGGVGRTAGSLYTMFSQFLKFMQQNVNSARTIEDRSQKFSKMQREAETRRRERSRANRKSPDGKKSTSTKPFSGKAWRRKQIRKGKSDGNRKGRKGLSVDIYKYNKSYQRGGYAF